MHHIVSDGWSMGVLVARARGALRGASRRAGRRRCRELPIQYADYAVWQRRWLRARCSSEQLAYWQRAARRRARHARAADRPAAPAVRTLPRRAAACCRSRAELRRGAPGAGPREGRDAVHGAARGVRSAAARATRARTTSSSARPSPAARAPEIEGLIGFFVNTLVAAHRPVGRPDLPRAARAACASLPAARTRTRTCPSRSSWRSCSPSAA